MVFLFAGFKLAVTVSAIAMLILVTAPLAVFIRDFLENPACMEISGRVVEQVNETHYLVELEIKYCSSVEIRDVKLVMGKSTIYVGTLERGFKLLQVTLSKRDVEEGFKSIELTIAGLYKLRLLYR